MKFDPSARRKEGVMNKPRQRDDATEDQIALEVFQRVFGRLKDPGIIVANFVKAYRNKQKRLQAQNAHTPHQGDKECARRRRHRARALGLPLDGA